MASEQRRPPTTRDDVIGIALPEVPEEPARLQGKILTAEYNVGPQALSPDSGTDSPDQWPHKYNILGVAVSGTTPDDATDIIIRSARRGNPALVTALAVHGLVLASSDDLFRGKINRFDLVAPDGQPVRWALNCLHGTGLANRVYGPELMLRLCQKAATVNIGVYLYGSSQHVVQRLRANLRRRFPELHIAGCEASVFRPLTVEEDNALTRRINESAAGLVFLGLGCPLQEHFAYDHRSRINAVQICVGAAFDFHSGNKRMAPRWMQNHGLEWLYRLMTEPTRLARRYLVTNSLFLVRFAVQAARRRDH